MNGALVHVSYARVDAVKKGVFCPVAGAFYFVFQRVRVKPYSGSRFAGLGHRPERMSNVCSNLSILARALNPNLLAKFQRSMHG